jgi:ABC-type Fe3+ transport system permease subunit
MVNRPKGVSFVVIIVFIVAVLALIVGISTIIPGTPLDVIWTLKNSFPTGFRSSLTGMIFGYFILILGLIMLYAGWGLLNGKKWAWWTILIIFAINGIGDAVSLTFGCGIDGISGILIVSAFIIYLTRPGVKEFFEKKS